MNTRLLTILTLLTLSASLTRAQNARHFLLVGDARYGAFDTEGAIDAFEEAHRLDPANPDVLVRLARTWNDRAGDLQAEGRTESARTASHEAIRFAERLVSDFPDDPRSWFYMAASTGSLALFSDGREKLELGRRIEEYCHRSIALDEAYALPHIALGMYYREVAGLGRLRRFLAKRLLGGLPDEPRRRALFHMAVAERLSPELPVVVFQRARTLEQFGHRDEAMATYRRFVRMQPMNSRDYRNLQETRERFDGLDPIPGLHADTPPSRSQRTTSNR